jgi:hypothetical protein
MPIFQSTIQLVHLPRSSFFFSQILRFYPLSWKWSDPKDFGGQKQSISLSRHCIELERDGIPVFFVCYDVLTIVVTPPSRESVIEIGNLRHKTKENERKAKDNSVLVNIPNLILFFIQNVAKKMAIMVNLREIFPFAQSHGSC